MPNVTVTGTDEVAAGFDKLARAESERGLSDTGRRIASRLVPQIRSRTPVATGALAVSWVIGDAAGGASIESPLRYSVPIEFGTKRGVRAYRMVRDTLDANTEEAVAAYAEAVAEDARRIGFEVKR